MKIGIYETEHFEGTYPVIRLFDKPGNELVIFTDPPTYDRFADLFGSDMQRFRWVVLTRDGSRISYFRQLQQRIRQEDPALLYINTISSNHILFAYMIRRLLPMRVVLTIHDIHCMFRSYPSWRPRVLLHHIGKRLLVRWIKEFNVVSETMVDYLKQEAGKSKVVHNVPGAVFDVQVPAADQLLTRLQLVVPGTLDAKRRDYGQVWQLLELAEELRLPVNITLLGGYNDAFGASVVKHAASLALNYASIRFYGDQLVGQDEFDRCLNDAHFIFIPSVINTAICFGIPEVYGLTKSSGNIFDVIKHARPFLAPAGLRIPGHLATSVVQYEEVREIVAVLQRVLTEPAYFNRLAMQAVQNSKMYTIDQVRARNASLFE